MSLGKTLRHAMIWGLLFIATLAGVGLWSGIQDRLSPTHQFASKTGEITLPRAYDGHFYATLELNGTPVDFLIDTGASQMVLSKADALKVGLNPDALKYFDRAMTANGEVKTARARIAQIAWGDIFDYDFQASVNGGEMDGSLLGNSYLQLYSKIEIRKDHLILTR